MSVRVKICGVTTREDALAAVEAGADALGFNFWRGSKRRVDAETVAPILPALPPDMLTVGVFVNASRPEIEEVLEALPLRAIQLHGDESPADCAGYPVPVIKALRAAEGVSLGNLARSYAVDYILVDASESGRYGGTGRTFPWERALDVAPGRLFLAGGLGPDNVAEAVRRVRPYAVDVASGVETESGRKDPIKMRELVHNARNA
ncbi:MAG: phosphoribosylanthranilate isomerase [Candidatus Binatia bacterium]